MALLFRSVSATTITSTSPIVRDLPAGVTDGTVLLMYVGHAEDVTITVPDGWALVDEITGVNGIHIYARVAGPSEPSSVSVSRSGAGNFTVIILAYFSDRGRAIIVDASDVQSNASSTDRVWPSVTTTRAGAVLACFATLDGNVASTPDGAMTERVDVGSVTLRRAYAMTQTLGAAGPTGTRTATGTAAASKCISVAIAETDELHTVGRFVTVLEDTYVHGNSGGGSNNTNFGTATTIATSHAGYIAGLFNGLLRPRYLDELPVGSILTGATLYLYNQTASGTLNFDFVLNSILAANGGWTDITATWNFVDGAAQRWAGDAAQDGGSDAGCEVSGTDYDAAALGSFGFTAGQATSTEYAIALDVAQVELWRAANHGLILRRTDSNNFNLAFHSSEAANVWLRPSLVLEFEIVPEPQPLDASLVKFLRVQAAKQNTFGVPVAPLFALPVVFEYAVHEVEQVAAWDSGAWTPTTIVEQTADYATFTLRGALFFEMVPVFFNAGFDEVAPTGIGPYTYSGDVLPGQTGDPAAYTFRFGGNDANRPPGSMVQVQDAYLQTLTLSFNLNDKAVLFESVWFGRFVDDNDGAGYAPEAVALPPDLGMVNGLLSTLGIQDAGAVGGAFDALAAFDCSLMEWQLTLDTGLRPAWAADGNTLTYCGVRHEWTAATFAAHLRTTGDNYAVTKVKSNYRTFQELRLSMFGADGRQMILDLTGRWLPNFAAHDRSREEVVMMPTFQAATPAAQTTSPHWLSYDIVTHWSGA